MSCEVQCDLFYSFFPLLLFDRPLTEKMSLPCTVETSKKDRALLKPTEEGSTWLLHIRIVLERNWTSPEKPDGFTFSRSRGSHER